MFSNRCVSLRPNGYPIDNHEECLQPEGVYSCAANSVPGIRKIADRWLTTRKKTRERLDAFSTPLLSICHRGCAPRLCELALDTTSALSLIFAGDPTLFAIVRLSLIVTLSATVLAAAIGLPLGAIIALTQFPGRSAVTVVLNGLMGLPPVVVGLLVYLALSRSGPLGSLGLLFTPQAMTIAQAILITPIIAALTRQAIADLWVEYRDELTAMDVPPFARARALLWDARFSLVTIFLAGFGRAAAEVGAVMIVGGNIDGFTRVMTTSIALETSKGNLALALGLGMALIGIILAVNALAWSIRSWSERHAG